MNKIKDYYIDIPTELIAHTPVLNRDSSRLLHLNKENYTIKDYIFKDIINLISKNDVLVFNDTKVFKARYNFFYNDIKCEILLSKSIEQNLWECIISPGKVFKVNFEFTTKDNVHFKVIDKTNYGRLIKFYNKNNIVDIFSNIGSVPLPPYIKNKDIDLERYQTVYSKNAASIAAPTAGLHFTKDIINELKNKGVNCYFVTLHIGLGTFKPIKTKYIDDFDIHSEYFNIDNATAFNLNAEMNAGKKIIAVGTTTVRALESSAVKYKLIKSFAGETNLFIKPPYKFKIIDKLITNFHLADSSLLLLVSAFAGFDNIKTAYRHAVNQKYRFFSFGDAMFIS